VKAPFISGRGNVEKGLFTTPEENTLEDYTNMNDGINRCVGMFHVWYVQAADDDATTASDDDIDIKNVPVQGTGVLLQPTKKA